MKRACKLIAAIFVIGILSAGTTVIAEEKTKEYNETWAASSVQSLKITNKFGEIMVKNEGGSEITINVVITVEARDEKRADDLLNQIDVKFQKSGSTIIAETSIEKSFKSQQKFSIDYVVNIPSDKNLKIDNKYGNTVVNSLTANGDFNIQHGNLKANELKAKADGSMKIQLAYGNADISSAGDLSVDIQYSNITLGEINDLLLNSKYSVVDIEEGASIQIESKYDKFNFEEVESVKASTKYSHIKIEELSKNLTIETGYGGVKVAQVASDFESISITNSYGQISLGLDDASYSIDASCNYCGISYPEDEFNGNKMKENQTQTIDGNVGSGTGGKVYIRSRYGEIRLKD